MATKNKVTKLDKARAVFRKCHNKERANVLPKIKKAIRGISDGMAARYFQIVRSEA